MFKDNLLVLGGLLATTALVSSCAGGEIGDAAGEARFGPESGAFDGGVELIPEVELTPEAAAEFSEDPLPGAVDRSAPATPNTAMQPEQPLTPACSLAAPDLSASNGWRSTQASQAAFGTLRFEFMARPAAANLNGLVAVGAQNIDEFSDAAMSVRFTGSGLIDARDGSAYASDIFFAYDPGVWYQISISADIAARTYDVAVGRCGEPTQALITGAAFRSDASVSDRLTTWALWSSQSATIELSTPMWIASGSCAPATCQSLGSECGQPSNGCNGTLSCGDCSGGEVCSSGVCIDAPVSVPPPPPACVPATCQSLSSECGQPSDGCGGSLNCGGCGANEMCSGGLCVDAPVSVPPPAPAPPPSPPIGDGSRPWAHNTGPSDPGALVPSGTINVTQDGALIEDVDVTGGIWVNADNVTIRNFRITATSWYGLTVNGSAGLLLEDGEITSATTSAIIGYGFTARRLHIHDSGDDGMKIQGGSSNNPPTLVEYSFIEKLGTNPQAHADGVQAGDTANNVTFQYNNFWMPATGSPNDPGPPYKSNATFIVGCTTAGGCPISNFLIDNNWLNGGGYAIYCTVRGNTGVSVINNKFGRDYQWGLIVGPCDEIKGNVWADTGDPI